MKVEARDKELEVPVARDERGAGDEGREGVAAEEQTRLRVGMETGGIRRRRGREGVLGVRESGRDEDGESRVDDGGDLVRADGVGARTMDSATTHNCTRVSRT
jgi:hypothetical protein